VSCVADAIATRLAAIPGGEPYMADAIATPLAATPLATTPLAATPLAAMPGGEPYG
jgi:hypothetical protein